MSPHVAYEFGGFRFDPLNLRLLYHGHPVPLTGKAADTLHVLLQQPNTLVTKEALLAAVWPDVAVEENNLNQQVSALRKALAQNGGPELIETVPRRGYRFAAIVRTIDLNGAAQEIVRSPDANGTPVDRVGAGDESRAAMGGAQVDRVENRPASRSWRRTRTRWVLATVVLAVIGGGVAIGWQWRRQQQTDVSGSQAALDRARILMRQRDTPGAIADLQLAIKLDPRNARAYSGLAWALHKSSTHAAMPMPLEGSPALEAAERSVALDPRCGECHGVLGFVLGYHYWQWPRAEAHLKEAIRLEPESESIRPSYAMVLAATGRVPQALEQIDVALQEQPYQLTWLVMRASFLYFERRYADALAAADRALAIDDKDRGAWDWRSRALFQLGRGEEAISALAHGPFSANSAELDREVREHGVEGALRSLLEFTKAGQNRTTLGWRRGSWRAVLGDVEGALDDLEWAYGMRNVNLIYTAVDPAYDRLRTHPRFQQLLANMGLRSAD